jgi:hypothetical protein
MLSSISLLARATDTGLGLTVKFDDKEIYHSPNLATDPQQILCEFDDNDDTEHQLEIVLHGKLPEHTTIDEQGSILQDRCIEISDVKLDDIKLAHVFVEQSTYHHDFNGTADPVTESFYGVMGCNGTVRLKFSSPVYLWLLENM